MLQLFRQRSRHSRWRTVAVPRREREGAWHRTITPIALEKMRSHLAVSDADFEVVRVEEKKRRHDVMAHVHAFGVVACAKDLRGYSLSGNVEGSRGAV